MRSKMSMTMSLALGDLRYPLAYPVEAALVYPGPRCRVGQARRPFTQLGAKHQGQTSLQASVAVFEHEGKNVALLALFTKAHAA